MTAGDVTTGEMGPEPKDYHLLLLEGLGLVENLDLAMLACKMSIARWRHSIEAMVSRR